jgi:hypothetical protein
MPFAYTSGNPDNLTAGGPARMQDIQGPFYDLRAYLNSAAGSGGGSGGVASALVAAPVLDVGMAGQVRAGRQLANADFTALGLSVPIALWNLGDLTDISGNGRVLANKGGVGFVSGINGLATTAAQFTGSTGQALYVADTGAADPFRIKTGSWGCWFRTAKRGTFQSQSLIGKQGVAPVTMLDQVERQRLQPVAPRDQLTGSDASSRRQRRYRRPLAFRRGTMTDRRYASTSTASWRERGKRSDLRGSPAVEYRRSRRRRRNRRRCNRTTAASMRRSSPPTCSPTIRCAVCTRRRSRTGSASPRGT